MWKTC